MKVCDLCGKPYHEGISVYGAGDDPLQQIELCKEDYEKATEEIDALFKSLREHKNLSILRG